MKQQIDVKLSIGAFAEAAGSMWRRSVSTSARDRCRNHRGPVAASGAMAMPDVARVRFVKSAQRLGFSLDEVAGLLTLDDGTHCDDARLLGEQKLQMRAKLADLHRIEPSCPPWSTKCCASHGTVSCPLIAALQEQ